MSIWGPKWKIKEVEKVKITYAGTLRDNGSGQVNLPKGTQFYYDYDGSWHEKIHLPPGEPHNIISIVHEATADSVIRKNWTDLKQDMVLKRGDVVTFIFTWRTWSRISHVHNIL